MLSISTSYLCLLERKSSLFAERPKIFLKRFLMPIARVFHSLIEYTRLLIYTKYFTYLIDCSYHDSYFIHTRYVPKKLTWNYPFDLTFKKSDYIVFLCTLLSIVRIIFSFKKCQRVSLRGKSQFAYGIGQIPRLTWIVWYRVIYAIFSIWFNSSFDYFNRIYFAQNCPFKPIVWTKMWQFFFYHGSYS